LTEKQGKIEVQVKYNAVEKKFSGTPEAIWLLLSKFFSEFLPSFEVANKLLLNVDLQKLAEDCEGIIAFSEEGANLMMPKSRLTDNETLLLWLLAIYLGHKLGKMETATLAKEELQTKLGKSGKITSTRLGELAKSDMVTKEADEKFKVTTYGVAQMQKYILPKIKAKATS
jgi:hypothetical protein